MNIVFVRRKDVVVQVYTTPYHIEQPYSNEFYVKRVLDNIVFQEIWLNPTIEDMYVGTTEERFQMMSLQKKINNAVNKKAKVLALLDASGYALDLRSGRNVVKALSL